MADSKDYENPYRSPETYDVPRAKVSRVKSQQHPSALQMLAGIAVAIAGLLVELKYRAVGMCAISAVALGVAVYPRWRWGFG